MAATRVPLIFGTMTIGHAGTNGTRISNLPDAQKVIDVLFSHGHNELDTARAYGGGTTEKVLSELDLKNAVIDTKVYPMTPGDHKGAKLREIFLTSLKALNRKSVRVLYLHAPDRSVPFEETAEEMNKLHKEGLFEIFGLSNFAAWEVAEMVNICKERGWVQPKIYQAMYNPIVRAIETELVPCLRKYGIRLVIYNPLAGGMFAGKVTSANDTPEAGSRFDASGGSKGLAEMYRARYLNDGTAEAFKYLKTVAEEHKLRLTEIALRWCQHHSVLTPEDGVILGASSAEQLIQNCEDSAKGPLSEEVVAALDTANKIVQSHGTTPLYWR